MFLEENNCSLKFAYSCDFLANQAFVFLIHIFFDSAICCCCVCVCFLFFILFFSGSRRINYENSNNYFFGQNFMLCSSYVCSNLCETRIRLCTCRTLLWNEAVGFENL